MNSSYALIKLTAPGADTGIVENIIVADPYFAALIAEQWDHIEPLDTPHEQGLGVGIGWGYDADTGTFTDPTPHAEPVSLARHISGLAFRRRFTKAERAAVEWAAVDKPDRTDAERQLAAALRADLKDQEQAKFIDLDDADLVQGVANLEAYGLLAVGRAAQIIDATVQDVERA